MKNLHFWRFLKNEPTLFIFLQAPDKKPLVRRDPNEDSQAKVRKGSRNVLADPVEDLEEFHTQTETI